MIAKEMLEIKWANTNKYYYIEKGYEFTGIGDKLSIKASDISPNSSFKVEMICDYCGDNYTKRFYNTAVGRKIIDKDACNKKECKSKKKSEVNLIITKGISNSLYNEFPNLCDEWNYKLNKIDPKDIKSKSSRKVWWKCKECNHSWESEIYNRVIGRGCPSCANKLITDTNNLQYKYPELAKEFLVERNGGILPCEIFPHTANKFWWKCEECSHEWETSVNGRTSKGSGCPKCNGGVTLTHEEYLSKFNKISKGEYIVKGTYINNNTRISVLHTVCNNTKSIYPYSFLKGHGCAVCFGNAKGSTEKFKQQVYSLVENEYEVVGEYINNSSEIKMKHTICGNTYVTNPSSFKSGKRCHKCNGGVRYNQSDFEQKVYDLVKDEYKVLGKYIASHQKLKMFHNNCERSYMVKASDFLSGRRCPICFESKGEQKIRKWLEEGNVKFEAQKEFEGLIGLNGGNLSYDFYLVDQNILIEYDGEYHYEVIKYKNETVELAEKRFKKQKIHDELKNEYAKNNSVDLIRIPYWDFDKIKEILNSEINEEEEEY